MYMTSVSVGFAPGSLRIRIAYAYDENVFNRVLCSRIHLIVCDRSGHSRFSCISVIGGGVFPLNIEPCFEPTSDEFSRTYFWKVARARYATQYATVHKTSLWKASKRIKGFQTVVFIVKIDTQHCGKSQMFRNFMEFQKDYFNFYYLCPFCHRFDSELFFSCGICFGHTDQDVPLVKLATTFARSYGNLSQRIKFTYLHTTHSRDSEELTNGSQITRNDAEKIKQMSGNLTVKLTSAVCWIFKLK